MITITIVLLSILKLASFSRCQFWNSQVSVANIFSLIRVINIKDVIDSISDNFNDLTGENVIDLIGNDDYMLINDDKNEDIVVVVERTSNKSLLSLICI